MAIIRQGWDFFEPVDDPAGYKSAAVCPNGHVATGDLERSPELVGQFCKDCGGAILTRCPSCNNRIRGRHEVPRLSSPVYNPPNYCEDCGNAFPWVAAKLAAANDLADELDITEADRAKIKQSIGEIARDTQGASLAIIHLKKLLGGASSAVGKAIWKITIDVATEAAKKSMGG